MPEYSTNHETYMREALKEAEKARAADEVPVGCVIVREGRIIARAHNQRETLKDPTAHAEMIAITQAASAVGDWRLEGCRLYVTLEPCSMCAGAIILARVEKLVYGAADPKAGACGSVVDLVGEPTFNHAVDVERGVLEGECAAVLVDFFKGKRGSA